MPVERKPALLKAALSVAPPKGGTHVFVHLMPSSFAAVMNESLTSLSDFTVPLRSR